MGDQGGVEQREVRRVSQHAFVQRITIWQPAVGADPDLLLRNTALAIKIARNIDRSHLYRSLTLPVVTDHAWQAREDLLRKLLLAWQRFGWWHLWHLLLMLKAPFDFVKRYAHCEHCAAMLDALDTASCETAAI